MMIPFLISFVVWALVHSVTAAKSTKGVVRAQIGERAYAGWYRFIYNVFALVTIIPVFYFLWTGLPERLLWSIDVPWRYATAVVQLLALVGLFVSLWQTDIWAFLGLRQVVAYLRGAASPEVAMPLVRTGPYGWVRHPLYSFSLLFLWLNPVMSLSSFVFAVAATLYFWIGSVFEERRLVREFGDGYRVYQQEVGRLLPIQWLGARGR